MRYELDNEGYVLNVYFGCYGTNCTEYTGTTPIGYESLLEWSEKTNINAYYINDGNLVYDAYRDAKLQEQIEIDAERNASATVGYVDDILNRKSSPFDETLAKTTTDLMIKDAGNYEIPEIVIEVDKTTTFEDGIKLQVSNANLLINTGKKETINGLTFVPTEDGRVHIKGTATADVEYELCGTMENKTPMFMMDATNIAYKSFVVLPMWFYIMPLFTEGVNDCVSIKLYSYNDEGRELINEGEVGERITLTENKYVTCATLCIPSGTTIDKIVEPYIRKQDGTSGYVQAKTKGIIDINVSELDPNEKIVISGQYIKLVNELGKEEVIKSISPLESYNIDEIDYTLIQCSEEANITTTYYTNINVAGFNITTNGLEIEIKSNYDYTQADIDKAYAYIRGTGTLTEAEMIKYDVNGDGIVNVYDCSYMSQLIKYGITTKNALKFSICNREVNNMLNFITVVDGNGNKLTNISAGGISTNGLTVNGENIVDRFSNLELNNKTEVGISSKDYLYLRGTDITNDKQHQLITTPNGILAQRKIDGTWNTDWSFQPYYVAGNTLTLEYYMSEGFLTGGGASINFIIVSPKLLDNISSISLESFAITIRHPDGGYLLNNATSIDGTIGLYKCSPNTFRVHLSFNTAFSKTNNVPISVLVNSATFKFN